MHKFNYHYNAIQGIRDIKYNNNFLLYSNGKIFNEKEYENILETFPEILEFLNNYRLLFKKF